MRSPYGTVLDEIPTDFVHPEQWPEYGAVFQPVVPCKREEVGVHPSGIRWSLWPITFEEYVGDEDPKLKDADTGALARFRTVAWKRVHRTDVPKGWITLSKGPWSLDGICRINPEEDYTKKWGHSGRRDLGLWRRNANEYTIEKCDFADYKKAYEKSTVRKKIGMNQFLGVERSLVLPAARDNLHLWVVRNKRSHNIVAGLAAVYSLANHASMYRVPFVLPEAKKICAMTGLVDHWFNHARSYGITTQIFTHFWQPGEPSSWKGSSEFKSHFITDLVAMPPLLWKWRRGKIF